MIHLHTHATPNGYKISIALEELELPYEVHLVDIRVGQQFTPEFTSLNPNSKLPVIVDSEGDTVVYESNAILEYLAAKAGRLMPSPGHPEYWEARQLMYLQAASVGPMFGQRMHFSYLAPEHVPYGITRYEAEGARLQGVMNELLKDREYFLKTGFSLVDVAMFGWQKMAVMAGYDDAQHSSLNAWFARIDARPAVQRGLSVPMRRDPSQLPPRKAA